jgi:hypothetical protein
VAHVPVRVITVTEAEPDCPSLVAVIVAVPTPCAVTSPVPLTVAAPLALVVHVMDRPASALLDESFVIAVN